MRGAYTSVCGVQTLLCAGCRHLCVRCADTYREFTLAAVRVSKPPAICTVTGDTFITAADPGGPGINGLVLDPLGPELVR